MEVEEGEEEKAKGRGGASECLIPGVTSCELELFMTALLYRAHKTISHTCSLLKKYVVYIFYHPS